MRRVLLVVLFVAIPAVIASTRSASAQTDAPTYTPYPTYTLYPTYTMYPTYTPVKSTGKPTATPTAKPGSAKGTPTPIPEAPKDTGTRDNPVPMGSYVPMSLTDSDSHEYGLETAVLEVVRGDAAFKKIKAANSFNDPPKDPDREYIMVSVSVKVTDGPSNIPLNLSPNDFEAVSNGQLVNSGFFSVVYPSPKLESKLFPKSSTKGWVIKEVYKDDPAPMIVLGASYDGTGGVYFALTPPQ